MVFSWWWWTCWWSSSQPWCPQSPPPPPPPPPKWPYPSPQIPRFSCFLSAPSLAAVGSTDFFSAALSASQDTLDAKHTATPRSNIYRFRKKNNNKCHCIIIIGVSNSICALFRLIFHMRRVVERLFSFTTTENEKPFSRSISRREECRGSTIGTMNS